MKFVCPIITAGLLASAADPLAAYGYEHDCIGSKCARWVPEYVGESEIDGERTSTIGYLTDLTCRLFDDYGRVCLFPKPTGRGLCADNLRREPWPDPAKEPKP